MNRAHLLLIPALLLAIAAVGVTAWIYHRPEVPRTPPVVAAPSPPPELARMPVLHNNRFKPFAAAAEELVYTVTGKTRWGIDAQGNTATSGALLLDWLRDPEFWRTQPVVDIPLLALREELGVPSGHASLDQLHVPEIRQRLIRAWQQRDQADKTIAIQHVPKREIAAAGVLDRASTAEHVFTGRALLVAPLLATAEQRAWAQGQRAALAEQQFPEAPWRSAVRGLLAAMDRIGAAGGDPESAWALPEADVWVDLGSLALDSDPLLETWPDPHGVRAASMALVKNLRSRGDLVAPGVALSQAISAAGSADPRFPSSRRLGIEMAYRQAMPFTWAWIGFIAGAIIAGVGLARGSVRAHRLGLAFLVLGLLALLSGLGLRIYLSSDRAAVGTLYDTFPFVAGVAGILGVAFAFFTRKPVFVVAAGLTAGLCAMVGEAMPPDLGSFLAPLQPVLRSRFWLWLHVKIIVASYGAFLLAWGMANIELWRAVATGRAVGKDDARAIYRVLQIGVVLCTAGTLLGGVWADESWGRFWGWDPKEVWALVIILVYLVPLHLKYIGAVGSTGLAAWAVFGFLSVVMSWYGVNFLLGAGLHAYATNSGFADSVSFDQIIVLGLCLVQIVLTITQLILLRRLAPAAK